MRDEPEQRAMHEHYERGLEQDRLAGRGGALEFARTKEIVLRHLPPAPATVADIGGGPGRYALWLAGLGYRVIHRDLVPLHVQQLRAAAGDSPLIESAVGDACELDIPDASADAVLLLGPLYHLPRRADRLRALAEARRVLRPGRPVFAAAISRWAGRIDGVLRGRLYEVSPQAEALLERTERTGRMTPLFPGSFIGFTHRPGQLRAEVAAAELQLMDLVGVEGPAQLLDDLGERLADERDRQVVLDTARALERVPELLGVSAHLLATARRPPDCPVSG